MNWLADSFMAHLPSESATRLLATGTPVRAGTRKHWTADDAHVAIVLAGQVKIFAEGSDTLVTIAGPGDLLVARFEPLPDSVIWKVSRTEFARILPGVELVTALMDTHDQFRRDLVAQVQCAGRRADIRLWTFLERVARRHGTPVTKGTMLEIGLTRTDYATAIRAADSSVDGALRRLRSAGRIDTGRRWVLLRTRE